MDYEYLKKHGICFGPNSESFYQEPMFDFTTDRRLPSDVREKLKQCKFTTPTPIQSVSIPIILKGNDFVGISKTGSGKTLAFLVPAFNYLREEESPQQHSGSSCQVKMLVVSPTRELALQTAEVFKQFDFFKSVCVYGGASRNGQFQELKRKPPVVIGTPGRIIDFMEAGVISMESCQYLVLDEADRMFDMGFHPQIMKIIDQCPPNNRRQTLLFSATWTEKVQDLAHPLLNRNCCVVSIGPLYALTACSDIKQRLFLIKEYEKKNLLKYLLRKWDGFKILVFCNTKMRTEMMCSEVSSIVKADHLHGDVSQDRRERIIQSFNRGSLKVIFATDVASRGLDIQDIHAVVNVDFPVDVETYVHRIGRSGRMGKKGMAYTFCTNKIFESHDMHRKLLKVIRQSGQRVPDYLE